MEKKVERKEESDGWEEAREKGGRKGRKEGN